MKKKIAILGSTGSIGKTTVNIIKKDLKNFNVVLLMANKDIRELENQSKILKVKNLVITNYKQYIVLKKKLKNKKINVYNDTKFLDKIFKSKIDYTMCAISGLDGLNPTLEAIKFSKTVAIANKEAIICGWNLIKQRLHTYKTNFIPVDSEHFSIWSILNGVNNYNIEKVYITASGGPFLNYGINKLKKVTPKLAFKHPNWKMGKKISTDSSTMMNKVFETIEAHKIFDLDYDKFKILIHPMSYVHAIVKFTNGVTKILVHDTNMKIPIFNSLYFDKNKKLTTKTLQLDKINKLNLHPINSKQFPVIKILDRLSNKDSLFDTIIVSANDALVRLFMSGDISFLDISKYLKKILNLGEFDKYKRILPKNYNMIFKLDRYVKLKVNSLCIKSSNVK